MAISKKIKSKVLITAITTLISMLVLALNFKSPEIKQIDSFRIQSYNKSVIKSTTNIELQNANWYTIQGKDIHFKIIYKEKIVAIVSPISSLKIPKNSIAKLNVEISFFPDSLKNHLADFLIKDSIDIKIIINGKLTFLGIPFHSEENSLINVKTLFESIVSIFFKKNNSILNFAINEKMQVSKKDNFIFPKQFKSHKTFAQVHIKYKTSLHNSIY